MRDHLSFTLRDQLCFYSERLSLLLLWEIIFAFTLRDFLCFYFERLSLLLLCLSTLSTSLFRFVRIFPLLFLYYLSVQSFFSFHAFLDWQWVIADYIDSMQRMLILRWHITCHGFDSIACQTDLWTGKETERQTGRQIERQTDREADRQTARHTSCRWQWLNYTASVPCLAEYLPPPLPLLLPVLPDPPAPFPVLCPPLSPRSSSFQLFSSFFSCSVGSNLRLLKRWITKPLSIDGRSVS